MRRGHQSEEFIELTRAFPEESAVCFDSDTASLEGIYKDELSAFRAKKVWVDTLESMFLLEKDFDFKLSVRGSIEASQFTLVCDFLTACGRYAFWRLTNEQAPEAQYTIETAHIPNAESLVSKVVSVPDMRSKGELPLYLERKLAQAAEKSWSIRDLLHRFIRE